MVDLFQINLEDFFYTDLVQNEHKPADRVEETVEPYQGEFSRLMMSRIKELEREIKENAPELAKRLGL